MIRNEGILDIWLGGSDIGSDGRFKWWDGSSIEQFYWADTYPKEIQSMHLLDFNKKYISSS